MQYFISTFSPIQWRSQNSFSGEACMRRQAGYGMGMGSPLSALWSTNGVGSREHRELPQPSPEQKTKERIGESEQKSTSIKSNKQSSPFTRQAIWILDRVQMVFYGGKDF